VAAATAGAPTIRYTYPQGYTKRLLKRYP